MLDKIEMLISKTGKAAELVKSFSGEIRLVSHYDCDGICSGAIMVKALLREGKRFRLSFMRQLTSETIDSLSAEGNRLTIFTDLGSGQLDAIQARLLKGGNAAIILDHHQPQGEILTDRLQHINTFSLGMGEHVSGSGIAYMLARTLSPENKELSEIGVIGAIGDSQIDSIGPDWGLFGLNKEILKDAVSAGKMSVCRGLRIWGRTTRPIHKALEYSMEPYVPGVSGSESGAVLFLQELGIEIRKGDAWRTLSDLSEDEMKRLADGIIHARMSGDAGGDHGSPEWIFGDVHTLLGREGHSDAGEFATMINAAGKQGMGYFGLEMCLNRSFPSDEVQGMLESYRREIGKALDMVNKGKVETKSAGLANYIMAGSSIPESVISNVTSILARSGRMNVPLFSFVDAEGGKSKVSARLPDQMSGRLNLKDAVEEAAKSVGGEGGGHSNAAGANIPKGSEEMFINRMETILTNLLKAKTNVEARTETVDVNGGGNQGASKEGGAGPGTEAGFPAVNQKVEGQGLVRYIGA